MPDHLTHAGVVVFRREGKHITYLVISSSDGTHWVLPKGHIDPGESPEETAARELKEEAGVAGTVLLPLTTQEFEVASKAVRVQYFLALETGIGPAEEGRTLKWLSSNDALALLSFPDAQAALRLAVEAVNDMAG
jgi:8-oxo-dGTP pyrophosphatase MutT (NUDIX family)